MRTLFKILCVVAGLLLLPLRVAGGAWRLVRAAVELRRLFGTRDALSIVRSVCLLGYRLGPRDAQKTVELLHAAIAEYELPRCAQVAGLRVIAHLAKSFNATELKPWCYRFATGLRERLPAIDGVAHG